MATARGVAEKLAYVSDDEIAANETVNSGKR